VRGVFAPIGGRAFEILELLVRSSGELVSKDELLGRVWPGITVLENTLHVHIGSVRRALGPYKKLLRTESGRGYRLIGQWKQVFPNAPVAARVNVGSVPIAKIRPTNNLPQNPARLVGRSEAERKLSDLTSAYRMVTLTGPGGIGKTSLAVQAARGLFTAFDDGGWIVELASISDPSLVTSAVAGVLGLKLGGEEISAEVVARAIGDRHILLILDNCEHIIDAAARCADAILRLCSRVTILATSREILRIDGEHVFRVAPLDVPPLHQYAMEELIEHSAIELLLALMHSQDPSYAPDATGILAAAEICRRLDGIPLAIEFAATRATTLGLSQVSRMLDDRFRLLTVGRRIALPRHKTLRATLDWSYDLLPAQEQMLLRHLSMFRGGFTVDAATAIIGDHAFDRAAVAEGIGNLIRKSLVVRANSIDGSRWDLLDSIRIYAMEKLTQNNELDGAVEKYGSYFRDLFVGSSSVSNIRLTDADWAHHVREIDNVRSAIDWLIPDSLNPHIGIQLTAAYAPVWLHLSLMNECRNRCEYALQKVDQASASQTRLQMWLQIALAASLFDTMGTADRARSLLVAAAEAAESFDDRDAQAAALAGLVSNYIFQAEFSMAQAAAKQLSEVAARIGNPAITRIADRQSGAALLMLGRPREAQQLFVRIMESHPSEEKDYLLWHPANHRATARALLARALWLSGFPDKACREAQSSIEELHAADHQLLVCRILYFGLCPVALGTGDFVLAEQSIARLIEVGTRLNGRFWQTAGRLLLGMMMVERRHFGEGVEVLNQALNTCQSTGWRMAYSESYAALAKGLAGLDRVEEALKAADVALAASRGRGRGDQSLYLAEALRIKGEVLLQLKAPEMAEESFLEALDVARNQEALVWELRTALSIAKARLSQGSTDAATRILAPVYGRFAEGFTTPDLQAAQSLLNGLN
jgi:predicted ATPase